MQLQRHESFSSYPTAAGSASHSTDYSYDPRYIVRKLAMLVELGPEAEGAYDGLSPGSDSAEASAITYPQPEPELVGLPSSFDCTLFRRSPAHIFPVDVEPDELDITLLPLGDEGSSQEPDAFQSEWTNFAGELEQEYGHAEEHSGSTGEEFGAAKEEDPGLHAEEDSGNTEVEDSGLDLEDGSGDAEEDSVESEENFDDTKEDSEPAIEQNPVGLQEQSTPSLDEYWKDSSRSLELYEPELRAELKRVQALCFQLRAELELVHARIQLHAERLYETNRYMVVDQGSPASTSQGSWSYPHTPSDDTSSLPGSGVVSASGHGTPFVGDDDEPVDLAHALTAGKGSWKGRGMGMI
ncbi:hypothetical protein BDV98DRAFT_602306 [Pterulicium gracile]|uniref:Uncharacterized protein n=1 Tax=Pterulicium gracile TaxID=1884261 RepID=A0A5C3QP76_9AGAR|nr:hypothetical protein BDV98DRAFT_602306 [Pterula gracilis]